MADQAFKVVKNKFKSALYDLLHPDEKELREQEILYAQRGWPPPTTFWDVLNSGSAWRQPFEQWAESTRRGENVHFLRAVEAYKAGPTTVALVNIVNRYIIAGAQEEVTLDNDQIVGDLMQASNPPPNPLVGDEFDEAYQTVVDQMLDGAWQTYVGQL
jgi:hypothetical protein